MSFSVKHRIISEIEKKRQKGQILHFLSGDAILGSDNYFYSIYYGIYSLKTTLLRYYLTEREAFDYFIYVKNDSDWECFKLFNDQNKNKYKEIKLEEFFDCEDPRERKGSLNQRRSNTQADSNNSNVTNAEINQTVDQISSSVDALLPKLSRLTKIIERGKKRILILLENLEWIANLYDEPKTTWIAQLQNTIWKKSDKLLVVVTIKDMELIKKYKFPEEETFISNPTAEEIFFAYWRYIMRNMQDGYIWDYKILNDIAHSMSVGKKSLVQCMRILRNVVTKNSKELVAEDFRNCAELNIEEKVLWEDVILDSKTKAAIENAVDHFLKEDDFVKARKGILLTGPPGTGKTMIAKALANEKKCYFMAPTLADLKAEFVGQSSAKVKRIFAEARGNQPTILFIDEADTVFPSRDLNTSDRDSFGLDMVNQCLQEIDGAKTGTQKIFIVAATNRPMAVDSAIRSRLSGTPITIPLPDYNSRKQLFNKKLAPFTLDEMFFIDDVLSKSDGMSGRDIDNFVKIIKENYNINNLKNDKETHEIFNKHFSARENVYIRESVFAQSTVIEPEKNKLTFNDIIGYQSLKDQIKRQADYIMAGAEEKAAYRQYHLKPDKGILMYGPPGNAKSSLAEAAAGEFGFYFIKIISNDFASSLPEQQIKKLTDIFQQAETFSKMINSPGIVLFFDEFDSLAGKNVLYPSVRGALLTYIDELHKNGEKSKILLMAATNFFSKIDDAVKRKGRFDIHAFVDNPEETDGKAILKKLFENDSSIVIEPDDALVEDIYDKLKEETKNNPEKKRQIIEETFGSAEVFELLSDTKKDFIENKIKNIRPSGADIKVKYEKLKENAFSEKSIKDGKLEIKSSHI